MVRPTPATAAAAVSLRNTVLTSRAGQKPCVQSCIFSRGARLIHTARPTSEGEREGEPLTLLSQSPFIRIRPRAPLPSISSNSTSAEASTSSSTLATDFLFWPDFFDQAECRALVELGLWKLDRADPSRRRTRARTRLSATKPRSEPKDLERDAPSSGSRRGELLCDTDKGSEKDENEVQRLFSGDYGFEEGHYDSVIHHYRETLLSSLPPSPPSTPALNTALRKVYSLLPKITVGESSPLPPKGTLTHLLHLAPHGEILPHVDNLDASGSLILGISLGAERTLRLERAAEAGAGGQSREQEKRAADAAPGVEEERMRGNQGSGSGRGWDVRLKSGSVYLQRDSIRYGFKHSILPYSDAGSTWGETSLEPGHRLSIMIRDAPIKPAHL